MKLLDEPKVTVGQIVKDLERIVKKNPEAIPTYGGAITSYISGIRFLKKGLLLLEESEDEDDALTARGLLGELREMPKDSKVVLQYFGWQMRNLLPDEDGIVFGCDDEDEYINLEMSESDIRLRSFTQWYKEIKRLAEKCSDRKIVCWDEHGDAYYFEEFVDEEDDDDRLYFTAQETDGEEVDFTVGSFLGGDRIGGGCGVCVCYSEDGEDYYFKAVDIGEDGNIFFEDKVGDEDVIACRLGDTIAQVGEYEFIYDDEEEEEEEDDDDDEDDDDWDEEDDEEDEDDEEKPRRSAREYVFQYAVKATVGRAIKDLKQIVKDNPEGYLFCSDPFHNGSDNYITGIKEWNGIVILKCNCDEDDALSAEDLLEELSDFDKDAGLVLGLGWGWELKNLDPEEDGTVFLCEDDEIFFHYEEHDIRLFSAEDLSHLFSDLAEKYPNRNVVCKTKDGSFYPVAKVFDDDGMNYIVVNRGEKKISASDFKEGLDGCYWSEGGVFVSFSPAKSYTAILAKNAPVFFEDQVDGEDVIAFRLGETLCDTRIEDPYGDDDFVSDDDTLVTVDDLYDEEEAAKKDDAKSDDVVEEEVAQEPETEPTPKQEKEPEQVTQADESDKGDIILKLVSYSGSVIKMMTTLSGIDGIDEEAAFDILQKLPSVVREGISAKTAMKIGAILEDAGATIELARASKPVAEEEPPKPVLVEPEPKPKPEPNPKPKPKPKQPKRPRMEYVDLGLSVKWAKWNLGASAPEEVGDYYSWGELSPKPHYVWGNYKFREDWKTLTKYNTKESYGKVDNVKQLELSDDAAYQILGGGWRMPTAKEAKELEDNCSWERMTIKGVEGWKYKSKIKGYTDQWIFFPDTGHKAYDMLCAPDEGFYWTSSLYTRRPDCGLTLFCNSIYEGKVDRFDGMCIRPVTK